MFTKIIQFKYSTNIHCMILVLHPHGRKRLPLFRVTAFYRVKVWLKKISPRKCLKKSYNLITPRFSEHDWGITFEFRFYLGAMQLL